MSKYREGYHVAVCTCPQGSHIGARKVRTPDCCERCGYLTSGQRDSMLVQFMVEELRKGFRNWTAVQSEVARESGL